MRSRFDNPPGLDSPGGCSPPAASSSVLLIGASVRAAAHSVVRAGLAPSAIDLFADRDLSCIAPTYPIDSRSYPAGLAALASTLEDAPWLYTGALENHPRIVDEISATRRLWGNPGSILRAVRDPIRVRELLTNAGIPTPRSTLSPEGLPRDGSWLAKPIASAGGCGIVPFESPWRPSIAPCYYQERIAGRPLSAIFLGTGSTSTLLGVTRQILGRPGQPFAYVGSLGPWPVRSQTRRTLRELGRVLVREFGMTGLFGVDFVLRGDFPWAVEINPRYTASVEVLERASAVSFLRMHAAVYDPNAFPAHGLVDARAPRPSVFAKRILFAECSFEFPDDLPRPFSTQGLEGTSVADIPQPGTRLHEGDPILTVFARGQTIAECVRRLSWNTWSWRRRLRTVEPGQPDQTSRADAT